MSGTRQVIKTAVWGAFALLASLSAMGCSCTSNPTIQIVQPARGEVFSAASDTDPDMPGVQIEVAVETDDLDGETITITNNGEVAGTGVTDEADDISIVITLELGQNVLVATAKDGEINSPPVTVTLGSGGDCPSVSFVTPEPVGDVVRLGGFADTDGIQCGEAFETTVVASTDAPDGTTAQIFVNDMPSVTATVRSGVLRFENVGLVIATDNQLTVSVDGAPAMCQAAAFPTPIQVTCEGVLCQITQPVSDDGYLNQSHDSSEAEGFQGNFVVETDDEGNDRQVQLIIDGNETDAPVQIAMSRQAEFDNVTLSEGTHRVRARCRDALGNTTLSPVSEYIVDITPCMVGLDLPEDGQLFIEDDDINDDPAAIDILAAGTAGPDCTGLRVGLCSGIMSRDFSDGVMSEWTAEIALASTPTQQVCAETTDIAGNIARASVGIRVNTDSPALEIVTPDTDSEFNVDNDLAGGNDTCETQFVVNCEVVDAEVRLVRVDTETVFATANCEADASVPSGFNGRATFPQASLPTESSWTAYEVVARQTNDRLTGESVPISVKADCEPPLLAINIPLCESTLNLNADDRDTSEPGLQYQTVASTSDNDAPVTLTIEPADGGSPTWGPETDPMPISGLAGWADATYESGGQLRLVLESTDAAGNYGRNDECVVNVVNLPVVTIRQPVPVVPIGASQCTAANSGTGVQFAGVTDAMMGAEVRYFVNGSAIPGTFTVRSGGAFGDCIGLPDGRMVQVRVEVEDTRGVGSGTVTVLVDTMPPDEAIGAPTVSIEDRRGGLVRFGWTDVDDAGGLTLSELELRCSTSDITSESDWDAAEERPFPFAPLGEGTERSEVVRGFQPGVTLYCVLRGIDPTGNYTPLGDSVAVANPFQMLQITPDRPSEAFGASFAALGDVSGDDVDDFMVGSLPSVTRQAFLVLGSDDPEVPPRVVRFTSSIDGERLGFAVAGVGDINGDTIADFAISAPLTADEDNSGSVYLFFGRDASDPAWPDECRLDLVGGCQPDVVLFSDDGVPGAGPDEEARLGARIAGIGDFDGDGFSDMAIGALTAETTSPFAGRVYIVRGGTYLTTGSTFTVPGAPGSAASGFYVDPPLSSCTTSPVLNCPAFFVVQSLGGSVIGDTRTEVLIGQPGNTPAQTARFWVLEGQAYTGTGMVPVLGRTLHEIDSGRGGAYTLALSGGDYDGDGTLDALVYGALTTSLNGQINVYRGTPLMGLSAVNRFVVANTMPGANQDEFGVTLGQARHPDPLVGLVGDIDRNGAADILAGSEQLYDTRGAVQLFYGDGTFPTERSQADVTFQEPITVAPPPTGPTPLGRAVAGYIGDVNADGYSDIAVGYPQAYMTDPPDPCTVTPTENCQPGVGTIFLYY